MNINPQLACRSSNPQKLSFKSNILYCGTVNAGEDSFIKSANFSELDPNNVIDELAIKNVSKNWKETAYTDKIRKDFLNKKDRKFYAVELDGSNALSKRIVALAIVNPTKDKKYNEIEFMQPHPELLKRQENSRFGKLLNNVKKLLIYGITKEAGKKNVLTYPFDTKFYFDIGMSEVCTGKYGINLSFKKPEDKEIFLAETEWENTIFKPHKRDSLDCLI